MERIPDVQVPRTISRVPTLSYGVLFFETFEEGRHHPDDRKFDVATQKHVAKDLMYWYVTKVSTEVFKGVLGTEINFQ
jgi:hypothetical protein